MARRQTIQSSLISNQPTPQVIVTCEHASNRVPKAYQPIFARQHSVVNSHRGWDPGALSAAKVFEKRLVAPLFFTNATRLLVEPNRSVHHPKLFSEFTKPLDRTSREAILAKYYFPYRGQIEAWIRERVEAGQLVIHLSIHSFVPELNGTVRNADVGLLYDPHRQSEKEICNRWKASIKSQFRHLKVRKNYPYLGIADGFTSWLRKKFADGSYVGIELELNQKHLLSTVAWRQLAEQMVETFSEMT